MALSDAPTAGIGWRWQAAAWLAAVAVAILGMTDAIAEWTPDLATAYFVWLCVGAVSWFLVRQRRASSSVGLPRARWTFVDTGCAVGIGAVALLLSIATAAAIGPLPPAYHDEYSYRFGAQTLLAGRLTWPDHPTHPDLFDQMHVLNEGVMASRYYPGTAAWMAPWLALGHPWWGHWAAGALSAAAVYGVGRELAGRRCGIIAGLLFAIAPGPALFSNLLLAHHPTLLGLMVFLWGFVHGQRTGGWRSFLIAGLGLSAAMLCRPATAAGFALPFGIYWIASAVGGWRNRPVADAASIGAMQKQSAPVTARSVICGGIALGLPLVAGWFVMLGYNHAVTGSWRTSPYQLYTDIYTPRHVYGLNNVVRGEARVGPKVLEEYDRWAENLTPALAWRNVGNRLLATGLWTIDLPLLVMTAVSTVALCRRGDSRWKWLALAIVSLHALHWGYWYVGIMGWHYVFESAPLWCLLCAGVTDQLWQTWRFERRDVLPIWSCGLAIIAWAGMYADLSESWPSRWRRAVAEVQYPRRQHAEFRRWVTETVGAEPALVLVKSGSEGSHLDFVINEPGLQGSILLGRFRPGQTDVAAIVRDVPERNVYLCRPDHRELVQVSTEEKP
jgi:hypothetical protein